MSLFSKQKRGVRFSYGAPDLRCCSIIGIMHYPVTVGDEDSSSFSTASLKQQEIGCIRQIWKETLSELQLNLSISYVTINYRMQDSV